MGYFQGKLPKNTVRNFMYCEGWKRQRVQEEAVIAMRKVYVKSADE